MEVITVVEGKIPKSKRKKFEESYHALRFGPVPIGLLCSSLLHDSGNPDIYHIETIWECREMLDKMREITPRPAAVSLFEKIGITPQVAIYDVTDNFDKNIMRSHVEQCK